MITDLRELNEVVNNVANYIVKEAAEKTSSGNWILEYDDVAHLISEEDYLQYFDLIENEVSSRGEVLDLDTSDKSFDLIIGLAYCPNYEWCEGDERVFGCEREEWESKPAEPVSQPLSLNRMAEIGENALSAIPEWFSEPTLELTSSLGLTNEELIRCGLEEYVKAPALEFYVQSAEEYASASKPKFVIPIEGAIETFKNYGEIGERKFLSYLYRDEYGNEDQGILLQGKDDTYRMPLVTQDKLRRKDFSDPKLHLSVIKAAQVVYPFDGQLWETRSNLEKQLGIFDRVVDHSDDLQVGKWQIHLITPGNHYGPKNNLVNDGPDTLVEFRDASQDKEKFPDGQFVSRYFMSELLNDTWGGLSLASMAERNCGFALDLDVPGWRVKPGECKAISDWLIEQKKILEKGQKKASLGEQIKGAAEEQKNMSKDDINKISKRDR